MTDNQTIEKGPSKGNRGPVRTTDGPVRKTDVTGTGPLQLHEALLIAPVHLTVLVVRVRADPLRKGSTHGSWPEPTVRNNPFLVKILGYDLKLPV